MTMKKVQLTPEARRALCALFRDFVRAARSKPPADGHDARKDTTPPATPKKTRARRAAKRPAS